MYTSGEQKVTGPYLLLETPAFIILLQVIIYGEDYQNKKPV
jgi:hypothetical protein